jgi:CelD/BcsL family acetyltransferase involved in cellulose biosynthesis
VLREVERAARAHRVHHLIVQLPEGGEHVAAALAARGYRPDAPEVAPSATLRIDLTQSLDRILARMSPSKRSQVRRSQREGIEIRLGGPGDLDLFGRLHQATARRQGFVPRSRAYLQHHWDALHPRGAVQIVFACHKGQALAAMWLTVFGDTVTHRLSGSNLDARKLQPNVACRWGAIRWAKEQGYRCFDLGGIERRFAELLLAGTPLPDEFHRSPAAFKREFGSEPVLLPTASHATLNPVARPLVRALYPRIARTDAVRRLLHRLRNG